MLGNLCVCVRVGVSCMRVRAHVYLCLQNCLPIACEQPGCMLWSQRTQAGSQHQYGYEPFDVRAPDAAVSQGKGLLAP